MRYFYRIAEGVSVTAIMDAVMRQPELWDQDKVRTTFEQSPHAQVNDILLRFGKSDGDSLLANDLPPMKLIPAKSTCLTLMALLGGSQLGRVVITKLEPGKKILPHADTMGAYAAFYKRYTLMLNCLPGVTYTCGDETVQMKTGEIWHVDVSAEHMVANNSIDDRIAMLIDIRIDP